MKNTLFALFVFVSFCVNAQNYVTKPTDIGFYPLQSPKNITFYVSPVDTGHYMSHEGKWFKIASATKKYSIWNHTGISNTGWATGKLLGFNSSGNLVPLSGTGGSGIALTDLHADSPLFYNNATGHFYVGASYTIPTAIEKGNYDTAYGWGNHSLAGYVTGTPWIGLYKTLGDSTLSTGFTRRDRLASQLATREPKFTHGTTAQYFKGDLSLGTFPTQLSAFTNNLGNYGSFLVAADISGKENTSNKVTSISVASTDVQYPSAKLLYDQLATKQASGSYLIASDISGKKDVSDSTATAGYTRRDRLASQIATREPKFTHGTIAQYFRGDLSLATFPTIPAAQIQSDWTQASTGALDFIKNKPSIPTQYTDAMADARVVAGITGKQNTLVSGTNIRTINGNTLLGSTDLVIGGSMTWPLGSGIPIVSTGSSWGSTISNGTGFLKNNGSGTYSYDNSTYLTSYTETDPNVYAWAKASVKPTYNNAEVGAAATSHSHGNITNAGAIGSTTALPIITTTSGVLTTGTFGTASGTFAQGNDSRINNGQTAYGWGDHSGLYVAASLTGKVSADNGSSFGYLKASDFTNTLGDISPNIKTINSTAVIGSGNFTLAQLAGSLTQNFNVATLGIEAGSNDWSVAGSAGVLNFTSYAASISFGTTGNITAANFILSSDRRLKQNIKPITFSNIGQIKFVQFDMKNDSSHRTRYGVIAQDVEKIAPELVYTDSKGIKSVGYIDLLIAKIVELEERIKRLENEK